MHYLQLGDRGRDVEVWQRFLAQIWAIDINDVPLGTFDATTDEATRAFQEQNGLEVSGILDRDTVEYANQRGLQFVDALVFKGLTMTAALAGFALFIMLILLTQCMVLPTATRNIQGTPLPVSPSLVPKTPIPPQCPGWFC